MQGFGRDVLQQREMVMKMLYISAAALCLSSAAFGAVIPGFSDVTDNGGGSFTFTFDTVTEDIVDTGLSYTNGAGLGFLVTADRANVAEDVRQDAQGGLGVSNGNGGDAIAALERLSFSFNQTVNILGFTLNSRGEDAADGSISLQSDGMSTIFSPAANFDGVGTEAGQQGSLCPSFEFMCTTSVLNFGSDGFAGFLDSITIETVPSTVPLPGTVGFLLVGLAGLGTLTRRQKHRL